MKPILHHLPLMTERGNLVDHINKHLDHWVWKLYAVSIIQKRINGFIPDWLEGKTLEQINAVISQYNEFQEWVTNWK